MWDVSGVASDNVWAVGDTAGLNMGGLILHWDGSAWTLVPRPVATPYDYLTGVSARTADDVWASGTGNAGTTLIEHWDGTAWQVVPSPNPTGDRNILQRIVAVGPTEVWASGYTCCENGIEATMVLHWDGFTWTVVPSPNPSTIEIILWDIAASGPGDIWTVGEYLAADRLTLILRPPASCSPPVPTPTLTAPPPPTGTATPTTSPTTCSVQFADVSPGSPFYSYIRCLACAGIVSGYPCGGLGEPCPGNYFRPGTTVTRGQTSKIVAAAAGLADPVPSSQQTFADVLPGSPFWLWIERLAGRGIVGGYPCGGAGESCTPPMNRPYFRPNNDVTRGQLAKITSGTAGWTETPTGQTFADVPPGSPFYLFIERSAGRGIVSGYPCGGSREPCLPPANRPYYRPAPPATRGQMSKIASAVFFPLCLWAKH